MNRKTTLFMFCLCALAGAGWMLAPLSRSEPAREIPASRAEVIFSFAPVVKKAQPAVVNVFASRIDQRPRNPLFDDPVFRHFFGEQGDGRPGGRTTQSLGSGVLVDSAGLVVTNFHVIEGMTEVKVVLA